MSRYSCTTTTAAATNSGAATDRGTSHAHAAMFDQLDQLEKARGNGTSMVTLYVGAPATQHGITLAMSFIQDELSTAACIKSRV